MKSVDYMTSHMVRPWIGVSIVPLVVLLTCCHPQQQSYEAGVSEEEGKCVEEAANSVRGSLHYYFLAQDGVELSRLRRQIFPLES